MGAAGAIPVLLPPVGEEMLAVLDRLDGLLLSGSPSNVHPELYGIDQFTHARTSMTASVTRPRCRWRVRRYGEECRCWRSAAASRS